MSFRLTRIGIWAANYLGEYYPHTHVTDFLLCKFADVRIARFFIVVLIVILLFIPTTDTRVFKFSPLSTAVFRPRDYAVLAARYVCLQTVFYHDIITFMIIVCVSFELLGRRTSQSGAELMCEAILLKFG